MSAPLSRLPAFLCIASLAVVSCGRTVTAPDGAIGVHDVLISVQIPGPCLFACDPPGALGLTLALVRVQNRGTATAYLTPCGQQAALREEQFVAGQWTFVGPAITCPVTPGPIALAPGDSIRVNWWFASGRRRIVLGVGAVPDLSGAALGASAAFDVP